MPVTIPVDAPTVAIDGHAHDHVPPDTGGVNVVVEPTQTGDDGGGGGIVLNTLTVVVTVQPPVR
jgi:hypothetical protein